LSKSNKIKKIDRIKYEEQTLHKFIKEKSEIETERENYN